MKVLKFAATWCAPCKSLGATLSTMELPLPIEEVDVDTSPSMMRDYGVRSVPTLVMVNEGNTVVKRASGALSKAQIEDFFKV